MEKEMLSSEEETESENEEVQSNDDEIQSHDDPIHSQDEEMQNQKSKDKFQCRMCDKYFNSMNSRRKHEIKVHKYYPSYRPDFQCSECLSLFPSRLEINNHLNTAHEYLNIKVRKLYFRSEEEFYAWKTTVEEQTISTYSNPGSSTTKNYAAKLYKCHRSGAFRSESTGKRRSKSIGSNKTGYFCPASIKMKKYFDEDRLIEVTYTETHVGHECEILRQKISQQQRRKKQRISSDHTSSATVVLIQGSDQKQNNLKKVTENANFFKVITQDLHSTSTSCDLQSDIIRDPIEFQRPEIMLLEGTRRLQRIRTKSAAKQIHNQIEIPIREKERKIQYHGDEYKRQCLDDEVESQEKEEKNQEDEEQKKEEEESQEDQILSQNKEIENPDHKQKLKEKVQCRVCDRYFSCSSNRRKHEVRIHKFYNPRKEQYQCSECLAIFPTRPKINEHLNTDHEYLNIKLWMLYFRSEEEFFAWKITLEEQTISTYIKIHTMRTKKYNVGVYICHRNGIHRSESTGKRRLKTVGSNKTGFFCPATIRMKKFFEKNALIEVTYVETHVGHALEVGRQKLSQQEKSTIASLLQEGVSKQDIIRTLSENAASSKKVPTRQDLDNIIKSYGLDDKCWELS